MTEQTFLAVDLGASSGRLVAARFDGRVIRLEEVRRFENSPVRTGDALYWDLLRLWNELLIGLQQAAGREGTVTSIGVDTWGVDFGLISANDAMVGHPHHYRDPRTNGVMERAFRTVTRDEIFRITGLQFLPFNTLFQLIAMRDRHSPLLEIAHRLLMMPDLFHWLLSGEKTNERTNASTTQFYNPATHGWATGLLHRFELPTGMLGHISEPGTRLGPLLGWVANQTGLSKVEVVLPATHDTASAVLSVPAQPGTTDWCYISSGTWSLLGAELDRPVLTDLCRELNFTNEVGVGGTIRLLKNIAGLWLLQESRRAWAAQGRSHNWEELSALAAAARPLKTLIDPDDASFLAPADMPEAISAFCRSTRQAVPDAEGALARTILESLALKYRYVLESLERILNRQFSTIHIIGGGTQNKLLCQFTANACGRRVLAGPVEATALGNALVQGMACGAIRDVGEARSIVRGSFPLDEYEPQQTDAWEEAYARFAKILPPNRLHGPSAHE